jgi:PAS domain S-box-containing protein/putative nucleotidyltransferase with HDIG domain
MSGDDQPMDMNPDSGPSTGEINISELKAVLDVVNGMFCVYDTAGQIIYINKKFKDLVGYSEESLQGMNIIDLAIERHKKRIRERMRIRLEEGGESSWELPIRGQDGSEFIVIAKTSPLYQHNQIVGEILLVEDITERILAETEVRESQRRLADTIESLPDATVVIDRAGRVLYWNREMVQLTGFLAADMVGKGDYEYSLPFYGIRRPILIDMIVDPKVHFDQEYTYIHKEGIVLYVETKTGKLQGKERILWGRAAPLFDTKGNIVGAIESVRDITDRKQAEEDLKKSHERLEAIFSGTVSALAVTTEKRDQYTAGHQQRVATLACAIAQEMGLSDKVIADIKIAGTLHDIGKLYIPMDILSQTNRLTDIEKLFVKTHPAAGYDILKSIPFEGPIAEIILQHHERLDGSGYPQGLAGDNILLEARILAVADVVEAMASHRPYRLALGVDKALEEIQDNAGRLYDEAVVKACVKVIKENKFEFHKGL